MSPSHSINFRPTDPKEKRVALFAVISFNDAHLVTYNRGKVYEYFGINERTAQIWCAKAAVSMASQTAQQPETTPDSTERRVMKRSRSEDTTAEVLSSISSGSHKGQKATRKAARGQKKRKTNVKNETVTPSPPPPQQLLTPPGRTASKQKKQCGVDDSTSLFRFGDESSDEYTPV